MCFRVDPGPVHGRWRADSTGSAAAAAIGSWTRRTRSGLRAVLRRCGSSRARVGRRWGSWAARCSSRTNPASWQTIGGELMFDAIQTAQGKPGSPLRAIYIGTLAPATGGWWHKLVESRVFRLGLRAGDQGRPGEVGPLAGDPALQPVDGRRREVPWEAAGGARRGEGR